MGDVFNAPSKIPYGGFSPVRLQDSGTDLSCETSFPVAGFDVSFSAHSATRSLTPVGQRHVGTILTSAGHAAAPRVLCSARVMLSLGIIATTARSASLTLTPRLISSTCTCGLANARPSLLWVINHSPRAITNTPGHCTNCSCPFLHWCHWPSPIFGGFGSPNIPQLDSRG